MGFLSTTLASPLTSTELAPLVLRTRPLMPGFPRKEMKACRQTVSLGSDPKKQAWETGECNKRKKNKAKTSWPSLWEISPRSCGSFSGALWNASQNCLLGVEKEKHSSVISRSPFGNPMGNKRSSLLNCSYMSAECFLRVSQAAQCGPIKGLVTLHLCNGRRREHGTSHCNSGWNRSEVKCTKGCKRGANIQTSRYWGS